MNTSKKDTSIYQILHYIVIVLLVANIALRIYSWIPYYATDDYATKIAVLFGIILVVGILCLIVKIQAVGYLVLVLWFGEISIKLLSRWSDIKNLLQLSAAVDFLVIFILALIVWWKIYEFAPFKLSNNKVSSQKKIQE